MTVPHTPADLSAPAIRAVLVADDGVYLIRPDGHVEPLLAPGHARPGCSHSTARLRP